MSSCLKVAFIGLGRMGFGMVGNLRSKLASALPGSEIKVFGVDKVLDTQGLSKLGVVPVSSVAAAAAENCHAYITMLPDSPAVEKVYAELVEALHDKGSRESDKGSRESGSKSSPLSRSNPLPRVNPLFIDCSTGDPTVWRKVMSDIETRVAGAAAVDCPVSGGVLAAANGSLTFMAGCKDPKDIKSPGIKASARISDTSRNISSEPTRNISSEHSGISSEHGTLLSNILLSMGKNVIYCGGPGLGQVAKLANNLVLAASMAATCEAANIAKTLGLDLKVLRNVLNNSSGKCWTSESYFPAPGIMDSPNLPSNNRYEGGFAGRLMTKDLKLAVSAAKDAKVDAPVAAFSLSQFDRIDPNKDFASLYSVYAKSK